MKKYIKVLFILLLVTFVISIFILALIPKYLDYDEIKEHLITSEDNDHLYIGIDHYANEINHMASQDGHKYLYSLDDGSRCYEQYLYAKASFFDKLTSKYTAFYYYPLSDIGAVHGTAININDDGSQEEYACYTVAVYYKDQDGSTHLLWKANDIN